MNDPRVMLVAAALLLVGTHGAEAAQRSAPTPPQELNGTAPQGIRQSIFALIKGKKYIGRIWLRATSGAKVNVALVWGEGGGRQTVALVLAGSLNCNVEASGHASHVGNSLQIGWSESG